MMESCWRTPSDLMGETKLSPIWRPRRGAMRPVPLFSGGETEDWRPSVTAHCRGIPVGEKLSFQADRASRLTSVTWTVILPPHTPVFSCAKWAQTPGKHSSRNHPRNLTPASCLAQCTDGPSVLIHSAVEGHWACFHLLLIMGPAAGHLGLRAPVGVSVFKSLGSTASSGAAGSCGNSVLLFGKLLPATQASFGFIMWHLRECHSSQGAGLPQIFVSLDTHGGPPGTTVMGMEEDTASLMCFRMETFRGTGRSCDVRLAGVRAPGPFPAPAPGPGWPSAPGALLPASGKPGWLSFCPHHRLVGRLKARTWGRCPGLKHLPQPVGLSSS